MTMTDSVRALVNQRMAAKGMNRAQLAREVGMELPNISRILNGRSGVMPESWGRILDALGLELVAVPKGTDVAKLLEGKG